MRAAVIINKSAGTDNSGSGKDFIKSAFEKRNTSAEIFEIPGDDIKKEILSKGQFDIIAAAGGDGTINSVINLTADMNLPFGVIPGGTFNHFAKDAGIPLDTEEAVEVIIKKHTVEIDIAEVNGHYFFNNSSVGIYPKIVKHRDQWIDKYGYSKWYAMLRALLNIFFVKYPLLTLSIKTEDHYSDIITPFIFIGNNRYQMKIFNPENRDRIDEGVLSIYYPETPGKFALLKFAFLALINRLNQAEDFHTSVCRGIKISSRKKVLDVSVDGEVIHIEPPLQYKIHPHKLKLIVP